MTQEDTEIKSFLSDIHDEAKWFSSINTLHDMSEGRIVRIVISHLAAICQWAPCRTCPPPLLPRLFLFCCTSHLSFTLHPSCLSHSSRLSAPHLLSFSPRCSPPRCTWCRPALSQSHLICSPLRLSDTQHARRGWEGGKEGADDTYTPHLCSQLTSGLMKPELSLQCVRVRL